MMSNEDSIQIHMDENIVDLHYYYFFNDQRGHFVVLSYGGNKSILHPTVDAYRFPCPHLFRWYVPMKMREQDT